MINKIQKKMIQNFSKISNPLENSKNNNFSKLIMILSSPSQIRIIDLHYIYILIIIFK